MQKTYIEKYDASFCGKDLHDWDEVNVLVYVSMF